MKEVETAAGSVSLKKKTTTLPYSKSSIATIASTRPATQHSSVQLQNCAFETTECLSYCAFKTSDFFWPLGSVCCLWSDFTECEGRARNGCVYMWLTVYPHSTSRSDTVFTPGSGCGRLHHVSHLFLLFWVRVHSAFGGNLQLCRYRKMKMWNYRNVYILSKRQSKPAKSWSVF